MKPKSKKRKRLTVIIFRNMYFILRVLTVSFFELDKFKKVSSIREMHLKSQ